MSKDHVVESFNSLDIMLTEVSMETINKNYDLYGFDPKKPPSDVELAKWAITLLNKYHAKLPENINLPLVGIMFAFDMAIGNKLIAVICTDGALNLSDIYNECRPNRWVPVLVYYREGTPVVVTFKNEDMAKSFAKRNLKKGWLLGVVYLGNEGIYYIKEKGWEIELMDWPRKISNYGFEVIEFKTLPEIYCGRL